MLDEKKKTILTGEIWVSNTDPNHFVIIKRLSKHKQADNTFTYWMVHCDRERMGQGPVANFAKNYSKIETSEVDPEIVAELRLQEPDYSKCW